MRVIAVALVGSVLIAIGALMLHGLVELADWIVEKTHHELSSTR